LRHVTEFARCLIPRDGTLAGWGNNLFEDLDLPSGTFKEVAAGYVWSLGLRTDGTLVAWGNNNVGQLNVPAGHFDHIAVGMNNAYAWTVPEPGSAAVLSGVLAVLVLSRRGRPATD